MTPRILALREAARRERLSMAGLAFLVAHLMAQL
jgi:hypothetical protein